MINLVLILISLPGVESEQETSSFKIYLEGKTLIIHSNELIKDIVITDLSGKGILKWDNITQPISLQQLFSGVYIVSVTLANDTTYQQKIILK